MSEIDEIRARHEAGELRGEWDREWLLAEVERLRAEVERLTRKLDEVDSVLAAHSGIGSAREWHEGGAWLYPGDKIVVLVVEDGK